MLIKNEQFDFKGLDERSPKVLREGYDRLKMKKWLGAGTLLGLYRDGDLIKGDTDIDVEVQGYEGVDEDILKIGFKLIRTAYEGDKPMQIAFQKDDTIFDVYIFWEEEEMINHNELGVMKFDKKFFQLTELDTKYGKFNVPSPTDEYLSIRYGKDWQTPKKGRGMYDGKF